MGALLSLVLLKEPLSSRYFVAPAVMLAGSAIIAGNALTTGHRNLHQHVIAHTHDGSSHLHRHLMCAMAEKGLPILRLPRQ